MAFKKYMIKIKMHILVVDLMTKPFRSILELKVIFY